MENGATFGLQVAMLADDILKNVEYDALRIVYSKFQSVVSFIPSVSTVLSPEVNEGLKLPPFFSHINYSIVNDLMVM